MFSRSLKTSSLISMTFSWWELTRQGMLFIWWNAKPVSRLSKSLLQVKNPTWLLCRVALTICSRTPIYSKGRNNIICECESVFSTGLETNLVDNDDLFKFTSDGWTGADLIFFTLLPSRVNVRRRYDGASGTHLADAEWSTKCQMQWRLHLHSWEDGESGCLNVLL